MEKTCPICQKVYVKRNSGETMDMWNRRTTCGQMECRTKYRRLNKIGLHAVWRI